MGADFRPSVKKHTATFENRAQNHDFFFERRFCPEILVKSLRGCEKWILQEILHRYSEPNIFSTFFFVTKNNFEVLKKNENFSRFLDFEKFSLKKKSFSKTIFPKFQK